MPQALLAFLKDYSTKWRAPSISAKRRKEADGLALDI